MGTVKLTSDQLIELCFALLQDKASRTKTEQKRFEAGRRKLLKALTLDELKDLQEKK